jgi:hypothetical protein
MRTKPIRIQLIAVAGGATLVITGAVVAGCGGDGNQTPPMPTTTTSTQTSSSPAAPAPSSTEKSINPTGGNLFTPGVHAPPAQTVPPGLHPGINGIP